MKRKHWILVIALAAFAIFFYASCCIGMLVLGLNIQSDPGFKLKDTGKQLLALPALQQDLYDEYPSQSIEVNITNGHIMEVNLIGSGFLDLPSETSRQRKAKEIATFITNHYDSIGTIDTITITLTERIGLGLNFDKFLSYVFYVNDLK